MIPIINLGILYNSYYELAILTEIKVSIENDILTIKLSGTYFPKQKMELEMELRNTNLRIDELLIFYN